MYVKKSLLMVGCLIFGSIGFTQSKKIPDKKTAVSNTKSNTLKNAAGDNSLLWEISGKGLPHPSYLFGTMHILCASDATLSENLKAIIKDCGQVFFEIDMDNMQELLGAVKFLKMNDGKKISDLLSQE